MTDVARRECQHSAWENYNVLFPDRTSSFLPLEQHLSFCLATQSILETVIMNATTEAVKPQPESALNHTKKQH